MDRKKEVFLIYSIAEVMFLLWMLIAFVFHKDWQTFILNSVMSLFLHAVACVVLLALAACINRINKYVIWLLAFIIPDIILYATTGESVYRAFLQYFFLAAIMMAYPDSISISILIIEVHKKRAAQ